MSRFSGPPGPIPRTLFASRTTFEALEVDSGEESEHDPSDLEKDSGQDSLQTEQLKLTKSAIKRANRAARIERKQRQRSRAQTSGDEEKMKATEDLSSAPPSIPTTETAIKPTPLPPTPTLPENSESHTLTRKVNSDGSDSNKEGNRVSSSDFVPLLEDKGLPALSVEPERMAELTKETISFVEEVPYVNGLAAEPAPITIANTSQDAEQVKKRQNALTRTLWTFIMIGGFIGLLLLGHAYMVLLVMLCQTLVYREVTALFSLKMATPEPGPAGQQKGKDPWSKTLNWYFFAVTNYFLYGESIIYYFKHVVFADANLLPFATNHRIISFTLYIIGFMGFVVSLKKGYLKQQFGLFCWVHMSLLLIVVSSHFIVNNILEGLIWFWVPASLVICNDCFAYIWGVTIGRTPLIKLSPKKTVEGFVGAFVSTVLFAYLWATYFMQFDYMICPVHDLGVSAFSATACAPNSVFMWRTVELWPPLSIFLTTLTSHSFKTISYAPYQLHALVLACFASLVAPFGGFFASGFKRAFNIKDFGHSIPGHGGMTDRMDCQFLMGVFTYVYYSSLIRVHQVTVGSVLQTIVSGLTVEQQLELIRDLTRYLERQGIVVS